ncbi:alpha/beta fold hydrolase [Mycolicibacterium lacusdiani]|uniref:alpha/beta fold hydrolase n=1 Tax=Mycolicibacterium lacusdiani TaxID=2895283 RepID=UPI001F1FB397|nr:alpha/beta fold hydrolase [Mycolicibacterium lacusdiani]
MSRRILTTAVVALTVAAGCAPVTREASPPPAEQTPKVKTFEPAFGGAVELGAPDLTDDGPGSLVSVEVMHGSEELEDANATYARVVYRSTSGIDDSPTEVSGVVAIPPGTPPKGGWPVISFGHGTTGVLEKCAPSRFPTLPGNGFMMQAMILNGFAVTMTDYQGLGVAGYYHPFLDSKTFGNNMIDAVRAARRVGADLSTQWVAFGHSLGGMAAWAAADRAGVYGQGLDLMGTLSMAPAADMAGMADSAWNGTLTADQRVAMVFVLQTLKWSHPELDLDRYRRGYTAANWDALLDCLPPDIDDILRVRSKMQNSDLRPETPADRDRLRDLLAQMALPQNKLTTPMMVVYGTQDTLVDVAWFEQAVSRACAQGDHIQIEKSIGQGHSDLDSTYGLPWLRDRLTGQDIPNSCTGQA